MSLPVHPSLRVMIGAISMIGATLAASGCSPSKCSTDAKMKDCLFSEVDGKEVCQCSSGSGNVCFAELAVCQEYLNKK